MEPQAPADPKVILLVEDNGIVREYAQFCMEDQGFRVLSAGSGEQALAMLDGHGGNIDLLVADVSLPVMSGVQLAVHVRRRDSQVRVLFVSGADMRHSLEVLEPNVDFLQKPYTPEALAQTVARMFASCE